MKIKDFYLLVSSIIFTFLAIEVLLRLFWSNPYAGSDTDKILRVRINHKNINEQVDRKQITLKNSSVLYRTNHRGYIEPALRFRDPDLTIAFLGGSTTECIAVQEKKRFPFLVSKLLEGKGLRVNSLNAARSGGTLHDSINVLLNHVILDHPDIVVLMHAANDIGWLKQDNEYGLKMGHTISTIDIGRYMLQIASTHSALAGFARHSIFYWRYEKLDKWDYKKLQVKDTEPFRARLKIFLEICKAFRIVPILITQPLHGNIKNEITPEFIDPNAQTIFNQIIRETGNTTKTEVIDLEKYISENTKDEDELKQIFYDGIHVTDHGSSLYALYIAERIHEIMNLSEKIPFR
jgi:lysophospholipase L1-like esterase